MILRVARLTDIPTCGGLDASYTSEYTWQLTQERSPAHGTEDMVLGLRLVRLPRPRSVTPPDVTQELEAEWDETDLFLVAEEDGNLIAYLCASAWRAGAWVNRLVVHKPYRGMGVATTLLTSAHEWAREFGIPALLAAVPTRNHPAVNLFRSRGYALCGFNERHFGNRDIALYLAQDVTLYEPDA